MIADRPLHGLLPPELGPIHPRRYPGLEGLANGPALVARFGHDLGDAPDAHPVWDIEADYLGQLCAQLALTLSPRRIVLGGGVCSTTACSPRSAPAPGIGSAAISPATKSKAGSMRTSCRRGSAIGAGFSVRCCWRRGQPRTIDRWRDVGAERSAPVTLDST